MNCCLLQTYRFTQLLVVFVFASITRQEFHTFIRLRRLCNDNSDFSEKSEGMCQFFYINVAILFLSFKQAASQHYKRLRRKTLTAFHSFSHFTLTTTQLNLSFLKTFNYSKTIQRPVLSFRDLY